MSEKTTQASQLESALWNAADVLRGKMDASEYKNYLLGLIFYRKLQEQVSHLDRAGSRWPVIL